jgi:hypothetical protein
LFDISYGAQEIIDFSITQSNWGPDHASMAMILEGKDLMPSMPEGLAHLQNVFETPAIARRKHNSGSGIFPGEIETLDLMLAFQRGKRNALYWQIEGTLKILKFGSSLLWTSQHIDNIAREPSQNKKSSGTNY